MTEKIRPCLWFDGQAAEAAEFYVGIFENSRVLGHSHYGDGMPQPAGTVLTTRFVLDGQEFLALNGGPEFSFTPAISLSVDCESQAEVDYFWDALSAGGELSVCGWLTDKYGLSWQVVPAIIDKMLEEGTPEQASRVLQAVMGMIKLDIAELEKAYAG